MHGAPATGTSVDEAGRPTRLLPLSQLFRISFYWLGLVSIFSGIVVILTGRLEFEELVPRDEVGSALFRITVLGSAIAVLVQPTVGAISDYTISRWGRRKPYILIGSLLDVVFLFGIASSNDLVAIAAFFLLLQVSSNFAQGPFQGYIPDLVPAAQVGLASGLVGLFSVLGQTTGFIVGSLAVSTDQFFLGTMALGFIELFTMLFVVFGVDEGRAPKPREGRSWLSIAASTWATDILRERSFVFLVLSRLFVLMGTNVVIQLGLLYLARSHGLDQAQAGEAFLVTSVIVAVTTALAVVPSGRASDRVGRKNVIYVACVVGAIGVLTAALAPSVPIAWLGFGITGVGTGIFIAVDWALMTDIIPKASSGRYMGISNVATASSGIFAVAIGGALIMDPVGAALGEAAGPRAAFLFGVACYLLGAVFLRPVDERRREDAAPAPATAAA